MRIKLIYVGIIAGCLIGISSSALAVNVGVRASTLGLGIEATQPLHPRLNARFGLNRFTYSYDATESGVDYEGDLKLQSVGTLLDWHPFAGGFRLSGGFLLNQNKLNLSSKSQLSFDIGNETYTTTDLSLESDVEYQPITPYLGIGWGSSPSMKQGWSVSAEIGVVFLGKPDFTLQASGSASVGGGPSFDVATNAEFQENLVREEHTLEQDFDTFQYYPVISIGFVVAF